MFYTSKSDQKSQFARLGNSSEWPNQGILILNNLSYTKETNTFLRI